MVLYFANRAMDILGLASTELMQGFHITDDKKSEDVDTGVAVFECEIHWTEESRMLAKTCATAGNYLLRSNGDEAEFYTIIECEEDTKDQTNYIYAEDAGMDLLNETVGAFAADEAHPAEWYILTFAEDSGFEIGINEISSLSRKLEWTGEATVAERIASVATQFDNAEIGYSFTIDGLIITHKYINIYKERGQDAGVTLRLNREVDRIITTTSVADLATALYVTGGTPEGEEEPITLKGYVAIDSDSDGDIYTTGDGYVRSWSALAVWSRYVNPSETGTGSGEIVHQWSYDTTSQSELWNRAVTQLQKVNHPAVNYDIEVTNIPENVGIGDYVYIVDEGGEVYLQARILQLETSICNETQTMTLGDYLINSGGLSAQVGSLNSQLANVQSQATSTAAEVYGLSEDVSELTTEVSNITSDLSNYVKTSDSVSITLSNSTGTATGTLRFSSGMSLSISALFSDYATQSWVTNTALSGYATQNWVTNTALSGYATQSWVGNQGYLTSSDLSGYATQQWVSNQGYLTSVPSGYATEDWVKNQGYLTSSSSITASSATKLATERTFALRYSSSNLSTATFDGTANVNLDVDNLMSKDLTFSGSDTFTKTVYVTGSYGQVGISASMTSDIDDGATGVGLFDSTGKSFIWSSDSYVAVGARTKDSLYLGAYSGWEGNIVIGSGETTVQVQGRPIRFFVTSENSATSGLSFYTTSHNGKIGWAESDSREMDLFLYIYPAQDYSIHLGHGYKDQIYIGEYSDFVYIGNSSSTTCVYGTFDNQSDQSLKKDISELSGSNIDDLVPVSFRWKGDKEERLHYGYIAQQVQEHIPELVTEGNDGLLGLAYTEIIPLLHVKINQMFKTIEAQQAKIESLEERIAKLEEIING